MVTIAAHGHPPIGLTVANACRIEPIGVIGVGWVGLVTGGLLRRAGTRGLLPRHRPGEGRRARARRGADLRARARRAGGDATASACTSPPTWARCSRTPSCCSAASTRRPPTRATPTSRACERVVEELGDSTEHALVMKSTVPVGTGRSIKRRRERPRLRVEPRVPQGGRGDPGLHAPGPRRRGRRARLAAFADRVAALYEPLGGPIVRTDVASAEMVKLASNAFLATKISFINEIANVSEELGADVTRWRAGWASTPGSARSSCGRGLATAGRASRRGDRPDAPQRPHHAAVASSASGSAGRRGSRRRRRR